VKYQLDTTNIRGITVNVTWRVTLQSATHRTALGVIMAIFAIQDQRKAFWKIKELWLNSVRNSVFIQKWWNERKLVESGIPENGLLQCTLSKYGSDALGQTFHRRPACRSKKKEMAKRTTLQVHSCHWKTCKMLSTTEGEQLRAQVVGALNQAKPPKSNISKRQRQALRTLAKREISYNIVSRQRQSDSNYGYSRIWGKG